MQVLAVLLVAAVAVANAGLIAPTTLVRTPSFDSAVIKSDRLGGNFAYSSVEGHAYAAVSPVVSHVAEPVGVSYSATPLATHIAAPLSYAAAPVAAPLSYAAAPIAAPLPYAAAPITHLW